MSGRLLRFPLVFLAMLAAACTAAPAPTTALYDLVYTAPAQETGELYLDSLTSSLPVRLFPAGTVVTEAAPSLDGTRIAFTVGIINNNQGNIYVINRDGSGLRQLTNDADRSDQPSWSPDGARIAFRSFRSQQLGEIWTMRADGTDPVNLTPQVGAAVIDRRDPAWSPLGDRIAFASYEGGNWDIWSTRSDGTDRRRLTATADGDFEPTWSPDARKIMFRRNGNGYIDLVLINPDGTGAQQYVREGLERQPAWSPDGTLISFAAQTTLTSQPEIWIMRPDGTQSAQRTVDATRGGGLGPAWLRRP